MEEKKEKFDPITIGLGSEDSKASTRRLITDILNGRIFKREFFISQLGFFFFLTFLGILVIGNRYHAEKIVREISKQEKELKDLQSIAIATSSELINWKNQANIFYLVKKQNIGLKPLVVPPKKLKLDE